MGRCVFVAAVVMYCFLAGIPVIVAADEYREPVTGRIVSTVGQSMLFLGRGITGSRYRGPGWREYLVTDRVALPEIHLSGQSVRTKLIPDAYILRARSSIIRSPTAEWYRLLQSGVRASPDPRELVKIHAEYTKAYAFLYRVNDDRTMLDRALSYLRTLPEAPKIVDMEGGDSDKGWGEYLDSAEAVASLCVAYDLLRDDMPHDLARLVERRTLEVTWQLVEGLRVTPCNNHAAVMAVAICTAALVFEHPGRYCADSRDGLFQRGMDALSESLALIAPDGGYAEGPYYGRYILNSLAPFAVHLKAATGVSLFKVPRLARFVNWVLDNHKGGGAFTAFDDSYDTSFLFLPLIAGQSENGREWDRFVRMTPPYARFSGNLVEALSVYRPRTPGTYASVSYPGRFYHDTGQCIFRDSWPDPGLFISLVNERMRYRADVHEHFDPLAMELSAGGEEIIIDGGYGDGTGDDDRSWFLSSRSNSTMLVDGYGADPNPHDGDRFDGGLDFAFSSRSFGAAGATQSVDDVILNRRVFFSTDGYILMLDDMDGCSEHSYSVRYLTPCSFLDRGDGRMTFQGKSVVVDAWMMPEKSDGWRVKRMPGMKTHSGVTEAALTVDYVSDRMARASIASLWSVNGGEGVTVTSLTASDKRTDWRRIQSRKTARTTDIVRSSGTDIVTPVISGNGSLFLSSYTEPSDPSMILAVDAMQFRQGCCELSCSRPALIYLERHDMRWSGYIDFTPRDEPLVLTICGIDARPVVVNGTVDSVGEDNGTMVLYIDKPGRISLGGSPVHIDVPVSFTAERDSLRFIAGKIRRRAPGDLSDDFDRTLFRNQAAAAMINGMHDAARHYGAAMFNDPDIVEKTADTVQGLVQSTYHGSRKGGNIILPHRYGFEHSDGAWTLDIREEGEWYGSDPRVRDLEIRGSHDNGSRMSYRRERPFADERRHSVDAVWRDDSGFGSSLREGGGRRSSEWYAFHRGENGGLLRPEVYLNEGELSSLRLHSRYRGVYVSFTGDGIEDDAVYSQNLSGTVGDFGWRADGVQNEMENRGLYRAGINSRIGGGHWFSVIAGMREEGGMRHIDDTMFDFGGVAGSVYHSGTFERRNGDFYFRSGASLLSGLGAFYAGLRLCHGFSEKTVAVTMRHSRGYRGGVYSWTETVYGYDDFMREDVIRWHQRVRIPLTAAASVDMIVHERFGGSIFQEAVGGGMSVITPVAVYAEVLRYRTVKPASYMSTVSVIVPWNECSTLDCSAHVQWSGHRADMVELRIDGPFAGGRRTGVFYRIVRPREKRLEMFMVWEM